MVKRIVRSITAMDKKFPGGGQAPGARGATVAFVGRSVSPGETLASRTQHNAIAMRNCLAHFCNHDYNLFMDTQTAIKHFGGRQELAEALGISREATYVWGSDVPYLRQCQLQVITAGKLVADPASRKQQQVAS